MEPSKHGGVTSKLGLTLLGPCLATPLSCILGLCDTLLQLSETYSLAGQTLARESGPRDYWSPGNFV